jgi:hypothetical protein
MGLVTMACTMMLCAQAMMSERRHDGEGGKQDGEGAQQFLHRLSPVTGGRQRLSRKPFGETLKAP